MPDRPHVVVLGAGFAGVGALKKLRKAPVRVTVVDRNDYHAFLPLLYQVATNQLGTENISSPVQSLISDHEVVEFMRGDVKGVDLLARRLDIAGRAPLSYDYVLLGLGARVNFFGTEGAQEHAFPLYTMDDAERLKGHIADCFHRATAEPGLVEDGLLRFCVVGGGATGVEIAGAIAELLRAELTREGGAGARAGGEVHIFEMAPELLMPFAPKLRLYAQRALERRGVQVHLGERVEAVQPTHVNLQSGAAFKTHTVIWAAGMQGNPLAGDLGQPGESRPVTQADLSLQGHPEVFLAGDMAKIADTRTGDFLPQLGSVAQQSGERAGENIDLLTKGRPTKKFDYSDKGMMAMIGRGDAIVQFQSGRTITGKPAWLAWKGVHLMLLAGGEDKARTAVEWSKDILGRSSRRLNAQDG